MNVKNIRKFVGTSTLLVGAVLTMVMPLLLAAAPVRAATACDPSLDPSCSPVSSTTGAGDADWADGQDIFVNKSITRFVKYPGTLTGNGYTINFTPAHFTQSKITGENMTLTSPAPTFGGGGTVQLPTNCPVMVLQVNNYKTATQATLKIPSFSEPIIGSAQCNGYDSKLETIKLANTYNDATKNGTTNATSNSSSSNSNTGCDQKTQDCCPLDDSSGLRWVMCPILLIAQGATVLLTGALTTFLYTPTDQIFTPQFHTVFDTFRNLGVALLVIAGLLMVISQAAGLEMFAAYTVRKALPRIIIAAIVMAVAWPLLQIIVTFFNDLGSWTNQLLLTAGQVPNAGSPQDGFNLGMSIFLGTGALVVAAAASTGILVSYVATLLLGLLVGFAVLAVRQLVILLCILTFPFAMAAFAVPGLEEFWKFWRKLFRDALLMFPIIMGIMGAGQAMSHIAGEAAKEARTVGQTSTGTTWDLLSGLAFIVPLFVWPFAFKLAGNIFGAVAGTGQGLFKSLRDYRANKRAQRLEDAKRGNFFKGNDALSRGLSTAAWGATNLGAARGNPLKWRERMHEARQITDFAQAAELAEKSPELTNIGNENDTLTAAKMLARGVSGGEVRSHLMAEARAANAAAAPEDKLTEAQMEASVRSKMTRAEMASRAGNKRAVEIAADMLGGMSGTQWMDDKYTEDQFDSAGVRIAKKGDIKERNAGVKMARAIAETARGDSNLAARLYSNIRSNSARAGRIDLGGQSWRGGFKQVTNAMNGKAIDWDEVLLDAFKSTDANSMLRGKADSSKSILQAVKKKLGENAHDPDALRSLSEYAAGLVNAQRTGGIYSSPQSLKIVNDIVGSLPDDLRAEVQKMYEAAVPRTGELPTRLSSEDPFIKPPEA